MVGLKSVARQFFGAVESALQVRRFDGSHPKDPGVAKLFGFGQSTNAGVRVNHDSVMAIPAIFRGINIISNSVSRVPFYVFKTDEEGYQSYATGHTSWTAVSIDPHPELKQVDFRRTMTAWAIGWGNAVAHIHRPGWPFGGEVHLTPLLPDRTIPVRITERMVKKYDIAEDLVGMLYYQTRINDIEVAYPASECLHIRGLGPNPYWGWDIVELCLQAFGGAQARAEFGHRFYGQGANPAGFVEFPTTLSEEAEGRLSESIKRGMEGMGKAHRIMVLEEGAKFHQWTVDPAKAQFLEGLQFDYRVLANIIGIKAHKLIDSANSAYASLEQANSEHRDDDLFPWIMQWTGEYNKKMLTDRQRSDMSHVIDIDKEYIDGWVPFKERAEGVVMLRNNDIITRDEGRHRLNWGPSKDRNGKRFTMPMNIEFTDEKVSMAAMASLNTAPVKTLPPPSDDPNDDPADDEEDDSVAIDEAESEIKWQFDCRKGDYGKVFVNGEEVLYVIACDVTNGRALVQKRDAEGMVVLDDKEVSTEIIEGDVLYVPQSVAAKIKEPLVAAQEVAEKTAIAMKSAWVQKAETRIKKQLGKTAKLLASKDPNEFLNWVDAIASETSPEPVQAEIDGIYARYKNRLSLILEGSTSTGLTAAVAAEVASWSSTNDHST